MKDVITERPSHYKILDPSIQLDPGWYRARNGRHVKIFVANMPRLLGYKDLRGAVWDNESRVFFKFGVWSSRGLSFDFGSYFDIISLGQVPSQYPKREEEEEAIRKAVQSQYELFRVCSSGKLRGKKKVLYRRQGAVANNFLWQELISTIDQSEILITKLSESSKDYGRSR